MNWVITGPGNGLSPVRRQAITWTNAGLCVNWTLGNISQWNIIRISIIFIQENAIENVVCQNGVHFVQWRMGSYDSTSCAKFPRDPNMQFKSSNRNMALEVNGDIFVGNIKCLKLCRLWVLLVFYVLRGYKMHISFLRYQLYDWHCSLLLSHATPYVYLNKLGEQQESDANILTYMYMHEDIDWCIWSE